MPYSRNDGFAVTNGNITGVNLAAGNNSRIVDRHYVLNMQVSNAFDDPERLEAIQAVLEDKESKTGLLGWAGSERVTLVVVFTDVVNSTSIGQELGDRKWREVRLAHFARSRSLIEKYRGYEIKTIGDSFMLVFKSIKSALDYALDLHQDTGNEIVRIRAGVHVGMLDIEDDDVFGGEVNYAARVVGVIQGAEIWVSDSAKKEIDEGHYGSHRSMKWMKHDSVKLKGFGGIYTLWSIQSS